MEYPASYRDTADCGCSQLMDVLAARGVKTIVLSPGSRNTPLMIACAARPELKKHLVTDERTAAFMALGIAMVSRNPVAIACTSGTALYNYAPAVAEAFYQQIPLIVISADRPGQWIDQDDSQTLRQFRSLENIVKKSFDIPVWDPAPIPCANGRFRSEGEWAANRLVNEAITVATTGRPGPVHINIQFANPLEATVSRDCTPPRTVETITDTSGIPSKISEELAGRLADKRVLLVAGFMLPDNMLNRAIADFATLPNVCVLCETLSNLHLDGTPYMIDGIMTAMSPAWRRRLAPDIVISIGGALVSRMLKDFLRSCEGVRHWTLADTPEGMDCFQHLALHADIEPLSFIRGITRALRKHFRKNPGISPAYGEEWKRLRECISEDYDKRLRASGWTELTALDIVFKSIPPHYNLFLSNGTCVRYAQLSLERLPHACYGNRGVSGIEGTNATALGCAMSYGGKTLLVTGDMSFAYSPQIMGLSAGVPLNIIVVSNDGGGIFRFIRTTRDLDIREEYFCAPPVLPLKALAEAYGWKHLCAENEEELRKALHELYSGEHLLLEIKADPQKSADALTEFLSPKH